MPDRALGLNNQQSSLIPDLKICLNTNNPWVDVGTK